MDRRNLLKLAGLGAVGAVAGGLSLRWGSAGPEGGAPPGTPAVEPTDGGTAPREVAVPRRAVDRRASERPSPTASPAAAAELAVVCRGDWGARPPGGEYRAHDLRLLTVHHTGVVARGGDGADRVRSHQRHHLDSGFVDLAYHHIVARDGTVFEGRPVTAPGETFTDYDPTGHYLPCLEGDFGRQSPTDAQLDALVALLAWASTTYGVPVPTVAGHRAYASTACPGDALQRMVDDGSLERAVGDLVRSGGVRLAHSCV